jgi:hypothetical protein
MNKIKRIILKIKKILKWLKTTMLHRKIIASKIEKKNKITGLLY